MKPIKVELVGAVGIAAMLEVPRDQWPEFLSRSLRGAMNLAIDANTDCQGCQAKELYRQMGEAIEHGTIRDKSIGFLMQAVGINIIDTGTMPNYGDIAVDLERLITFHDED